MNPPKTTKAAPARGRPSEATVRVTNNVTRTVTQTADKNTLFPAAIGRAFAPAGRRRLWVSIVERCPYCGGDHVHRGTDSAPAKGPRPSGCSRRVYYVVPQIKKAASQ